MSADNYLAVRDTVDGRFVVTMEFASCDSYPVIWGGGVALDGFGNKMWDASAIAHFDTAKEAVDFTDKYQQETYCEYGVLICTDAEFSIPHCATCRCTP